MEQKTKFKIRGLSQVYKMNRTTREKVVPYTLPENDEQLYLNACANITQITKAYNGDVVLNWDDDNQPKYYLYFRRENGSWVFLHVCGGHYVASAGSGYYFAREADAREAAARFRNVWLDYLPK